MTQPPDLSDRLNGEGLAHVAAGRDALAEPAFRRALALSPAFLAAAGNLANAETRRQSPSEAVRHYRWGLATSPQLPALHLMLATAEISTGSHAAGERHLRIALCLLPGYGKALANLGILLRQQSRRAELVCRWTLACEPYFPSAVLGLAGDLIERARTGEAFRLARRTIALHPQSTEALQALAQLEQAAGVPEGMVRRLRRSLAIAPDAGKMHQQLVFAMLLDPATTNDRLFTEYRRWGDRHNAATPIAMRPRMSDPQRPLKVGYLSADFYDHPISYLFETVVETHDRTRVIPYLFAEVARPDAVSHRLRAAAHAWHSTVGLPDREVAQLIDSQEIDILVIMAGHTGDNRLAVGAHRPAPIQVVAYDVSTSGLDGIDYWLTDGVLHPSDTTEGHTETLERLPSLFLIRAPEGSPPVSPAPSAKRGGITFGSFANSSKLNDDVLDVWARILAAVPSSRLLLAFRNAFSDPVLRERIRAAMARRGVDPDRLAFDTQRLDRKAHLARVGFVDISLDPFPYDGCNTAFESLWMGVPVVTLAGDRAIGRMCASFLHSLGMPELIADTGERYVEIAVGLARDPDRLAAMRAGLRPRVLASPICDGVRYTRTLEDAYRRMWQRWCARQ